MAKVAFVSTMGGVAWGGSEELWYRSAKKALAAGHETLVSIFNPGAVLPGQILELKEMGAKIDIRPFWDYSNTLLERAWRRFKRDYIFNPFEELIKFNPDIVCVSQGDTYHVAYDLHLQKSLEQIKKPFYIISQFNSEVGALPPAAFEKARYMFQKAASVIFVSERNREVSRRQLCLPLTNSIVISNPLNITDFQLAAWPSTDVFRFGCVGRLLCISKGQDLLFQALSENHWKDRNWILNLYGKGGDEGYLKELTKYFGLEDKINFVGHVSDIRKVWEANHIIVMPSIGEGTPLALMEAMMCGRPAMVTDVGGNTEMIEEGRTGFISEAASPRYIGRAMERAWKARENWQEMGLISHQSAKQKIDLTPELTLLKIMDL